MNCFAHALPFLDRPIFMTGCCVPDWLSAADRKCRVREKDAAEFLEASDDFLAQLAAGIVKHHQDDAWFHQTRAFSELSMLFSVEIRAALQESRGHRSSLLGHILVELLLDAYLITQQRDKLTRFYEQVASIEAARLQDAINQMAGKPTSMLTHYRAKFLAAKFLFDYGDDDRLMFRVDQVLRRVKLASIEDRLNAWIPSARERVYDRATELLPGLPVA